MTPDELLADHLLNAAKRGRASAPDDMIWSEQLTLTGGSCFVSGAYLLRRQSDGFWELTIRREGRPYVRVVMQSRELLELAARLHRALK